MKMQEAERGRRLRKEPIYPCSLGPKRPHRFLGVIEKCIHVSSKANPILANIPERSMPIAHILLDIALLETYIWA